MAVHEQNILDQLHDIYGMVHIPFWQTQFFYWSLLILAVIMSIFFWLYIKKRRYQRSEYAWERALRELEQLECRGLLNSNQQKLFYSELTRIIKEYFQQRFGVFLTSKTDDELLTLSASLDIAQEAKCGLQSILDGVIFIKFAQAAAARERMQRDLLAGKELINATRPAKQ